MLLSECTNKTYCQACIFLSVSQDGHIETQANLPATCTGVRYCSQLYIIAVVMASHDCMQGGMELRVLHAAAKKVTWYGQWGYNYGRGAFNITHSKYVKSRLEAMHQNMLG